MNTNISVQQLTYRLGVIHRAEVLLGPVDFPAIAEARAAMQRVEELDAMAAQLVEITPAEAIERAAEQVVEGKLDAKDLLLVSTQIHTGTTDQALAIIDQAKEKVAVDALRPVNKIGEAWVPLMRPLVDASLAVLDTMRRQLPTYPVSDTDLEYAVAHNLQQANAKWDELFGLTSELVQPGADVHNSPLSQYLHPDRFYRGHGSFRGGATVSFLAVQYMAGARPGVWTQAEVQRAAHPLTVIQGDGDGPARKRSGPPTAA